jgi:hypothetical protein
VVTFRQGDYGGVITDAEPDAIANGRPLANAFYQLKFT